MNPTLAAIGSIAGSVTGPFGVLGLFMAGLIELGVPLPVMKGGNTSGWVIMSAVLITGSNWWANHRQLRMTASTQASAEIGRTVLLNAVTPDGITAIPSSPDSAVARAIVTQLADPEKS